MPLFELIPGRWIESLGYRWCPETQYLPRMLTEQFPGFENIRLRTYFEGLFFLRVDDL